MSIRKIVVPLLGDAADTARLRVAGVAAARVSARLDLVFIRHDPREAMPFAKGRVPGDVRERLMDALADQDDAALTRANTMLDDLSDRPELAGVTIESIDGPIETAIARRGRAADLVVIANSRSDRSQDADRIREVALFSTGRPVLVAPDAPADALGSRVVVAWNGSAEAARAVEAAMPFLRNAEDVTVATIVNNADEPDTIVDMVSYLDLHGVDAGQMRHIAHGASSKELVEIAELRDADLLVMGAYTHSRLRELFVGGATKDLMRSTPLPILMMH